MVRNTLTMGAHALPGCLLAPGQPGAKYPCTHAHKINERPMLVSMPTTSRVAVSMTGDRYVVSSRSPSGHLVPRSPLWGCPSQATPQVTWTPAHRPCLPVPQQAEDSELTSAPLQLPSMLPIKAAHPWAQLPIKISL